MLAIKVRRQCVRGVVDGQNKENQLGINKPVGISADRLGQRAEESRKKSIRKPRHLKLDPKNPGKLDHPPGWRAFGGPSVKRFREISPHEGSITMSRTPKLCAPNGEGTARSAA